MNELRRYYVELGWTVVQDVWIMYLGVVGIRPFPPKYTSLGTSNSVRYRSWGIMALMSKPGITRVAPKQALTSWSTPHPGMNPLCTTDRSGFHVVSSVGVCCSDADRLRSSWAGNIVWKVPSGRRIRCWTHSGPPVRIFNQSVTTTTGDSATGNESLQVGAWFGADIWLNRIQGSRRQREAAHPKGRRRSDNSCPPGSKCAQHDQALKSAVLRSRNWHWHWQCRHRNQQSEKPLLP